MNMMLVNVQNPCREFAQRSKPASALRSLVTLSFDTQSDGPPDYESGGREFKSLRARQYYQRLTPIDELAYTPLGAQLGAHNERLAPATAYPPTTSATTLGKLRLGLVQG